MSYGGAVWFLMYMAAMAAEVVLVVSPGHPASDLQALQKKLVKRGHAVESVELGCTDDR